MTDPREGLPRAQAGAPLQRAKAAMVMLHGRGASAENILSLADVLAQPDIAYLAPQAPGHAWYPQSFLAPIEQNEPHLSRALDLVGDLLARLALLGFPADKVILLGFSQGGCLAAEFAARHPRRYAGVIGLSAGLIGPPGMPRDYAGSLTGTPVFLGCSDVDPHIPLARVRESTRVLRALGGEVTERVYPGFGHAINDDEIAQVRRIAVAAMAAPPV
ncbi:MAG: alpha/beta hydrolase [Pseudorhodoplanes sp.]